MSYLNMLRKINDERAFRCIVGFVAGKAGRADTVANVDDILNKGIKLYPRNALTETEWSALALHYLDGSISDWGDLNHFVFDGRVVRHSEARLIVREESDLAAEIIKRYKRMVDQVIPEVSAELGHSCEVLV